MDSPPPLPQTYGSPRWSAEIADCSVPMTFDQYSACSYRCLYCFSFYQRSLGSAKQSYLSHNVRSVNPEAVKAIFTGADAWSPSDPDAWDLRGSRQFYPYIKAGLMMQWGGLSDPFDETERRYGIGLDLLRFFRARRQPITFSTKGAWWTEDPRYVEVFQGADHFHLKVSIVTLDPEVARKVEVLCPSPQERLAALRRAASWGLGGVTLRLRPFILGISSRDYEDLIRAAADAGVDSVTTEFYCLEQRARLARRRIAAMSRIAHVDLLDLYRRYSAGRQGYLRLSRPVKQPYIERMAALCDSLGLRFYVSDADFKEYCANASCCGIPPSMPYSRGHFTYALLFARDTGRVRWSDIAPGLAYLARFRWGLASGFNTRSAIARADLRDLTMFDWLRRLWNNPNAANSPYKYFGGVLVPEGRDEHGDVIYVYRGPPLPSRSLPDEDRSAVSIFEEDLKHVR